MRKRKGGIEEKSMIKSTHCRVKANRDNSINKKRKIEATFLNSKQDLKFITRVKDMQCRCFHTREKQRKQIPYADAGSYRRNLRNFLY